MVSVRLFSFLFLVSFLFLGGGGGGSITMQLFRAYWMRDVIYHTRETVFHRDFQTLRRELKIRRAMEYFWRNSRCLGSRWNTISIETKTKAWTEKWNRQNLCFLRLGIQASFTVVIFFVLTWWIINEFEKILANTTRSTSSALYHLISNVRSGNNC